LIDLFIYSLITSLIHWFIDSYRRLRFGCCEGSKRECPVRGSSAGNSSCFLRNWPTCNDKILASNM